MASTDRGAALAEGVLLAALVAAPWAYGCAPDWARYTLCAVVSSGLVPWSLGRAWRGEALPPLVLPALALPAVGLVQVVLARSVAPVWTAEAVLVLVAFLGAAVFWSERARDHAAALRLAWAVLATCAAQAAFGAFQWQQGPDRLYGRATETMTTPFGSYVDHNHFAGLVGMGALLAAGLTLGYTRAHGLTAGSVALGGLTLAQGATLLASRSRGGLVALVSGLGLLAVLQLVTAHRKPERSGRLPLLVPLLALGVVVFGLLVIPEQTRAHLTTVLAGGGDASSAYRLDVARDGARLVVSRPLLGSGLGAFSDAFPPWKRAHGEVRTTHAESDVLELLIEAGLAGVLACAGLFGYAARRAWQRLRDAHSGLRKGLVLGAVSALGALGVHSLFDFNLRLPANALMASMLLGLVAVPRKPPSEARGRWRSVLLALVLGIVTASAAWRAWGASSLDRATGRPQPLLRVAALDETLRAHPYLDQAWLRRGLAQRSLGTRASAFAPRRLSAAEDDLTRAVRLRPQWGEAWAELGWTRLVRGDGTGALEATRRALALDPTHAGIAFTHAHTLAWSGDTPGAVQAFAQLVEQYPDWWTKVLSDAVTFTRDRRLLARLTSGDARREKDLQAMLAVVPQP